MNKHFKFVDKGKEYWYDVQGGIYAFEIFETRVTENLLESPYFELERKHFENFFLISNRGLEDIISTFNHDPIADENKLIESVLQSLQQWILINNKSYHKYILSNN